MKKFTVTHLVEVEELHAEVQLVAIHQGQVGLSAHVLHEALQLRPGAASRQQQQQQQQQQQVFAHVKLSNG
jgi:uncharacterized protein involved in outer membrane biogenesis